MERGRPGERYLLGGVNWTCGQFLREVAKLSGRRAPMMSSPTWLSLLMAPILRKAMPMVGRKFTSTTQTIEMSGLFWYCDSSKAARELGFKARDPLETLRDTLEDIYLRRPELRASESANGRDSQSALRHREDRTAMAGAGGESAGARRAFHARPGPRHGTGARVPARRLRAHRRRGWRRHDQRSGERIPDRRAAD